MPARGSIIKSLHELLINLVNATFISTPDKHHRSLCTYCAEVFVGAVFPAEPALQQHVLQLVTQPAHHLRGVDAVIWGRGVVVEVQQIEETLLVAVLQDGQAPLHHCVVGIHQVHPVATVIQVILGQGGNAEQVLVAESNGWERHVMSPDHIDFGDGRVGQQVEDTVRGPYDQQTDTHEEGKDPDGSLWFGLVCREDKLQTVDLRPLHESHCDFFPCWLWQAGLSALEGGLWGIVLFMWPKGD